VEHVISIITDPTVRQIVGPAVSSGLGWAMSAVRKRYADAPKSVKENAEHNVDAFADLLAIKVAEKIRGDTTVRDTINEELETPKGFSALQKAMEVAAEVDDEFTRENLAELVARRLTARGATRLQLATRIGSEALAYLTEQQLRLLAFMIFVQGHRPGTVPTNESEWTSAVIDWMRALGPSLIVSPDMRDLGLLASAGLVDVMPGIIAFDLKASFCSSQGFIPQLDEFLTSDPLGARIKTEFTLVMLHRLNLAGQVLAVTVSDKITGVNTDLSVF